ncbi:MAG TPA: DEAD/DEAH box helicase [Chitinophagales bacterium]|nr:DEAD/DEAH box helicase [Chitinophagales bacterium]HQV79086.1 DEAD/DEAH box helicase [Chitinophagales bacterium]HQW79790.1 DEAD/DEAH box helicase [Chitinophagales bacterium]HRB67606.1 DEAD/DEAH box helicase [Chitinophagales bacterium]
MNFDEFGLDTQLLDGIDAMNYKQATPVQVQVIPHILNGKDLIASAQTGTGKTAAFLLPTIHNLITKEKQDDEVNALIIVPTRELAVQIAQNLEAFSYFTPISSIAIYGGGDGSSFESEKRALSNGVDIAICTPGRMISHLASGYVRIKGLKYLILDEADRMLNMGFYEDILKIIKYLPEERQTLMFSATMPVKIRKLALEILKEPEQVNISISKPPEKIQQRAYIIYEAQKNKLIKIILTEKYFKKIIVFCSRIENAKKLSRELNIAGIKNEEIHSGIEQSEREQVILNFRSGKTNIIVATDVLARGIDIEDISLVINFDVPNDAEDYVHRIGRTARAETDGIAITLVSEADQYKLLQIEDLLGYPIVKEEIPLILGETPIYNPIKKEKSKFRGKKNLRKNKPYPPKK